MQVPQLLPGRCDIPLNCINTPVPFESELFKGTMQLYLPGLESSPQQLFQGKRRKYHFVFQGKFKRPVCMDDLMVGCYYERPFDLGSSAHVVRAALRWLAAVVPGGTLMALGEDHPHVLAPVAAVAQLINVNRDGEQPDALTAQEDTRLLGANFQDSKGRPLSAAKRRAYFYRAANRRKHVFNTEHVWTIHSWEASLGFGDCRLHAPIGSLDLVQYLDGMPLHFTMRDSASGSRLVHLNFYTQRQAEAELLKHASRALAEPSVPAAMSAASLDAAASGAAAPAAVARVVVAS